jgi:hypothetical protein
MNYSCKLVEQNFGQQQIQMMHANVQCFRGNDDDDSDNDDDDDDGSKPCELVENHMTRSLPDRS